MESGGKPHALPKYPPLDCACLWVPHARLLAERGQADSKACFRFLCRQAPGPRERQAPAWLFSGAVFFCRPCFSLAVMEGVEMVFAGLEPGAPRLRRESQKLWMVSPELKMLLGSAP